MLHFCGGCHKISISLISYISQRAFFELDEEPSVCMFGWPIMRITFQNCNHPIITKNELDRGVIEYSVITPTLRVQFFPVEDVY